MKVVTSPTATVDHANANTDQQFSINFDAKMARILADGLYSDKVQSVIRELSCNAYDSHVEAGNKDYPIEIHLPTYAEPWFHVRDFGVGLSHDQVMKIYTQYGASTKTNSNDVIGQLGLGSKSPFSITDSFTVEARQNGIENHYKMYRNEQGMPCVAHLHQGPTSETDGVTVKVPVNTSMTAEFAEKARNVYKWFPIKPTVVGGSIIYNSVEYAYRGSGWGIGKGPESNRYGWSRRHDNPVALMGLVAYPLDVNSIKDITDSARTILTGTPLVLEFDIGELEVAANREALGYDSRTCANINTKLSQMLKDLATDFANQISSAKTLWEAKLKFGEIFSKSTYANVFGNVFRDHGFTWGSFEINNTVIDFSTRNYYPIDNNGHVVIDIYQANHRYKRPRKIIAIEDNISFRCDPTTVIMFNDLDKGGLSRVAEYNKNTGYRNEIWLFGPSPRKSWSQLREALGNPEVIMTSSLAKPERKVSERTDMLKWNGGFSNGKKAWLQVTIDLDNAGHCYYVELNGWDVQRDGKYVSDLGWYIREAKAAGIIHPTSEVYAMRNKNKKLVREHANWKELFSTIKNGVMNKISKGTLAQEVADNEEYTRLCSLSSWRFWESGIAPRAHDSVFKDFCAKIDAIKSVNRLANLDAIKNLASRYEVAMVKAAPRYDLTAEFEKVKKHYPMLDLILGRISSYNRPDSAMLTTVGDYIDMVDACWVFYALQDRTEEE